MLTEDDEGAPNGSYNNAGQGLAGADEAARRATQEFLGPRGLINKSELVRLMQQSLHDLGYASTAKHLEQESGIQLQTEAVDRFRNTILAGRWPSALELLGEMEADSPAAARSARFVILKQQFLEALEQADINVALRTLRTELAPLSTSAERRRQVHRLASLLMCSCPEDLRKQSGWEGAGEGSRQKLLRDLQGLLPPATLLPERRLQLLLEQALDAQRAACHLHNTRTPFFSLLEDHKCHDQIPKVTTQILEEHTDEVWHLQFSHDGGWLASASKDGTARIWRVDPAPPPSPARSRSSDCSSDAPLPAPAPCTLTLVHTLMGHTEAVAYVAWSPDDARLLTCGNDAVVRLWDTSTGQALSLYGRHSAAVTACAWMPDGKRFITGGYDKNMFMWDLEGNELQHWHGGRINDLVVTADGAHLVSTHSENCEKRIVIYHLQEEREQHITESHAVTSLSISRDGRYLLVNLQCQEIHQWDLGPQGEKSWMSDAANSPAMSQTQQVMRYQFHGQPEKQGRFVIRSCFGGSDESFVVSGSEDSQVYIWHGRTGDLLEVLPGHSGTVNAVTWNPTNPHMLASASDDHTIRIWGVKGAPAAPGNTRDMPVPYLPRSAVNLGKPPAVAVPPPPPRPR